MRARGGLAAEAPRRDGLLARRPSRRSAVRRRCPATSPCDSDTQPELSKSSRLRAAGMSHQRFQRSLPELAQIGGLASQSSAGSPAVVNVLPIRVGMSTSCARSAMRHHNPPNRGQIREPCQPIRVLLDDLIPPGRSRTLRPSDHRRPRTRRSAATTTVTAEAGRSQSLGRAIPTSMVAPRGRASARLPPRALAPPPDGGTGSTLAGSGTSAAVATAESVSRRRCPRWSDRRIRRSTGPFRSTCRTTVSRSPYSKKLTPCMARSVERSQRTISGSGGNLSFLRTVTSQRLLMHASISVSMSEPSSTFKFTA